MSTILDSLRGLVFAPPLDRIGFAGQGFPVVPSDTTRRLKAIPQSVVFAATLAGGCDAAGMGTLRDAAEGHAPDLALGAVFAAKARNLAGFVTDHTHAAAVALTGLSPDGVIGLADDAAVASDAAGPMPAYELWRRNIREHLVIQPQRLSG